MSFSLIVKEFKRLSVLYLSRGNEIGFLTGVHWTAKWELKSSNFILKSNASLLSGKIGDMAGVFVLFQKSTYDWPKCFWSCIGFV